MWAADAHNCHTVAGLVPHMQLPGSWPDLTPLAPFYFNNSGGGGRFSSRSLLPRYIGPARQHMIGATRVQVDHTVRVVCAWRFVAAPDATVDPATLLVTRAVISIRRSPRQRRARR